MSIKKVEKKVRLEENLKFSKMTFFIFLSKSLFFFLKTYEKFLFFRSNFVYFFCLRSGFLKKRNIFSWNRVKIMKKVDDSFLDFSYVNSFKCFFNILDLKLRGLNFFKSNFKIYFFEKKIKYIKFNNLVFKLYNKFFFNFSNKLEFSLSSNFFYNSFFFFKLKEGYVKFFFSTKNLIVEKKNLSYLKDLKNPFFFDFLDRYFNFFKEKSFFFKKNFLVVFKSLNFVWDFLVHN